MCGSQSAGTYGGTFLYWKVTASVFRTFCAAVKPFGSTNEIGIFEMSGSGLVEVDSPSGIFLTKRTQGGIPGTAVAAALEGTRPLLVEIQALVCPTGYGTPRRMTAGVDYNRVALVAAVLEKRVGFNLGNQDIYVNAVGGVRLDEPAADLAIACALASSFKDIPVDPGLVCAGETGLTGELRPVAGMEKRLREAFKMGFSRFLMSGQSAALPGDYKGLLKADTLEAALEIALLA